MLVCITFYDLVNLVFIIETDKMTIKGCKYLACCLGCRMISNQEHHPKPVSHLNIFLTLSIILYIESSRSVCNNPVSLTFQVYVTDSCSVLRLRPAIDRLA